MGIHIQRSDYLIVNAFPTTIPEFVGQVAINPNTDEVFISKGTLSVDDWISSLGSKLELEREIEYYDVKNAKDNIPITIDFDPDEDILNVYNAGVRLEYPSEYTLNGKLIVPAGINWLAGDRVTIEVIRGIKEGQGGAGGGNPGGGGGGGIIQSADQVPLNNPINGKNNVQESLEDLNDELTKLRNLITSLKVSKYTNIERLQAESSRVAIGIPQYNADTDILNMYIAGAKVVENQTFTIDKNTNEVVCLNGTWMTGTQMVFEVLKNTF